MHSTTPKTSIPAVIVHVPSLPSDPKEYSPHYTLDHRNSLKANIPSPDAKSPGTPHSVTGVLDRMKTKLRKMESHTVLASKPSNEAKLRMGQLMKFRGSVVPKIFLPWLLITCWTVMWTLLHSTFRYFFFVINPLLITIMGLVVSLMLVFRNNTAYDRYWEGRRTWSSVTTHCRNLCRVLHTMADHTDKDARAFIEKRGALHMILAFPVATKYLLRGEQGIKYTDLFHLLAHIPAFSHSKKPRFSPTKVPLEILWHLNAYINRGRKLNVYDAQGQVHSLTALAGLADALTVFERIRGTPVPLIYKIHVKMVLLLYLMSLPFQLVQAIGFFTIPVVAIAAFVFLGIESIALEIENPFGEDPNDLPLDDFINQVRGEIWDMEKYTERFGQWGSWNTEMVDDGKEHVEVDHEGLGGGGGGGGGGGVVDAD